VKVIGVIVAGVVAIMVLNVVSSREMMQSGGDTSQRAEACNGVLVLSVGGCNVNQNQITDSYNTGPNSESTTEMILSAVVGVALLAITLIVLRKPLDNTRSNNEG